MYNKQVNERLKQGNNWFVYCTTIQNQDMD